MSPKSSRKKKCILIVESARGYAIKDQRGDIVPIEEAKRLYDAGLVEDFNMAFGRLVEFDFNLDELKAYYEGKLA